MLCISVKLKNLIANHNLFVYYSFVYLLCISVKLKNLKANHNLSCEHRSDCAEIIGIIANIPLYNFEYNRNIAIFAAPNNTQYEV